MQLNTEENRLEEIVTLYPLSDACYVDGVQVCIFFHVAIVIVSSLYAPTVHLVAHSRTSA